LTRIEDAAIVERAYIEPNGMSSVLRRGGRETGPSNHRSKAHEQSTAREARSIDGSLPTGRYAA
jgi:hypothetical protein